MQDGLWTKCNNCNEIVYRKEVERNLNVCPKCNYHFRISSNERIKLISDNGALKEIATDIEPIDFLGFRDTKKYRDRIKQTQEQTGLKDAIVCGELEIDGKVVAVGVFDFNFLGGSMGSVVGEKIVRLINIAIEKKLPLIIFFSSGGARMQEGVISLFQMAKTSAGIVKYKENRLPYISILTDPTTGGVSASIAMLGDIIIAEPKALIGFAGPRVIEETIRQKLPEGFQRAEFLLEHGLIDMIVERKNMKKTLSKLIDMLV